MSSPRFEAVPVNYRCSIFQSRSDTGRLLAALSAGGLTLSAYLP